MRVNAVKCALAQGKLQLGTGLWQLRSVEIPRMLAAAGFHWVFIDTEHGGLDVETVQDLCRVSNLAGLCPLVRVTDMQYALVARALDMGAQGVVFPRVEDPKTLEKAISWTKFPPVGVRGFGLSGMQIDYESATMPQIIEHMNANSMVVLQIETQRAVEARDELLAVPGVDAVMVGPADLSVSLGVPGDFQHPRMVEAMEAVRDSCLAHGVAPGTQTRAPSFARFWKERGMKFLGCSNDWGMLLDRATEIVSMLKD
jgi:2-keto-3-deoxy-L-rhamnonate aldolase RhmA